MLKELRQDVGLGCPPGVFTKYASESLNAALKRKVNYKETEWLDFNEAMKQLVQAQRDEAVRPLSGHGKFRLDEKYLQHAIPPQNWIKMTPE